VVLLSVWEKRGGPRGGRTGNVGPEGGGGGRGRIRGCQS